MTQQTSPYTSPAVTMHGSARLYHWLEEEQISLAFTTYQTNRLFLVGRKENGHLAVNERLFDKPMGLYAKDDSLYLATRYQIWQLENRLGRNEQYQHGDRLYVPSQAHTTGDLNVHDVVVTAAQEIVFINTDFSCLAKLQAGYSFVPLWQPPFITKLAAEDRCHLNGLAMQDGKPTYVTACSETDEAAGWRNHRVDGGIVMHIPSSEIIARGLSMPHSPRWYQDKLWVLNSGTGELGYLNGERFEPVTFCPGFVRGLAFWKNFALVGLSKLRSKAFTGLTLETRLAADQMTAQCGLAVVDLNTGTVVHVLHIDGVVEELFDVLVLPGIRQPRALGFQTDDIDRLISFPGSGGLIVTKPTVKRPGLSQPTQTAGLPRPSQIENAEELPVKYQRVYHLTPENLLPYEAMTEPSLQKRWQSQPPRGEITGIAASLDGELIGLVIAEAWQEDEHQHAELLSSYVLPAYRHLSIERKLHQHLQKAIDPLSLRNQHDLK
ncbi:TIGR03032 family protein [Nitrosomonas sp. JL21]|uniref:TIGR03032 family protein n=1 Tax=Nitrosomonas sp. JL21 TaxID=153949 RepID=UPI00136FD165|nr:TIGR03032 family protein [Nitrosomonas sp. JL21]MBL8498858.1 TIGR03032 family protein [Nitrosomonas sp.]MXS77973.1 TIGR03032 family protein [Nitrosomonas sp. JL21]